MSHWPVTNTRICLSLNSVAFVCLLVVSTLRVRSPQKESAKLKRKGREKINLSKKKLSRKEREKKREKIKITGYILIFWHVRALCGEMVHAQSTLTQPENVFFPQSGFSFLFVSFVPSLFSSRAFSL